MAKAATAVVGLGKENEGLKEAAELGRQILVRLGENVAPPRSFMEVYNRVLGLIGQPLPATGAAHNTREKTGQVVAAIGLIARVDGPRDEKDKALRSAIDSLTELDQLTTKRDVELWAKLAQAALSSGFVAEALHCCMKAAELPEGLEADDVESPDDLPEIPKRDWYWMAVSEMVSAQAVLIMSASGQASVPSRGGYACPLLPRVRRRRLCPLFWVPAGRDGGGQDEADGTEPLRSCGQVRGILQQAGRGGDGGEGALECRPRLPLLPPQPWLHRAAALTRETASMGGWLFPRRSPAPFDLFSHSLLLPTAASPFPPQICQYLRDVGIRDMDLALKLHVTLCDSLFNAKRYADGLLECQNACNVIPASLHRDLLRWKVVFQSRLGKNVEAEMLRVADYPKETQADVWAALALQSECRPHFWLLFYCLGMRGSFLRTKTGGFLTRAPRL